MIERCSWQNDPEIGRWHLPGCIGAAVYGPQGCTCQPRNAKKERQDLEERVAKLEQLVACRHPSGRESGGM